MNVIDRPAETRDKVNALEKLMLEAPQVELEVKHYFSQGVYCRELHIPKDTLLTGKIHKYEQLNILLSGEMSVLIDNRIKRLKAPFTFVAPAGTKRIALAHEDCVWLTIHGTDEIDLDIIEHHFIAQSEQEYLEFIKDNQLALPLGN